MKISTRTEYGIRVLIALKLVSLVGEKVELT